jgi:hydrogenase maturation protein HypF
MTPTPGSEIAVAPRRRLRIRVEGIVQGVGFRPYLYRLAHRLGLVGHAQNDTHGVLVEVEGTPAGVAEFLDRLELEAPPLAAIERVAAEEAVPRDEAGFVILESDGAGPTTALVAADAATCDDCLSELFDPADRRFRYPFINCTHCGPRFTIIRAVPYDRPLTTMAGFTMCARCRAEYEDPADRRFHAQPNACPECGPRVWLVVGGAGSGRWAGAGEGEGSGEGAAAAGEVSATDPIRTTCAALRAGAIVAIKGLGGFHLACLARDPAAVQTLRERKRRPAKPLALMVPDLARARRLVHLDAAEEALLQSRERPIVLARRRTAGAAAIRAEVAEVAEAVAPGQRELGIMLPYTPLHHLLLSELGEALVLTSGNLSDEPIAYENDDALARLSGIADLFLLHDRPIRLGVDDSVARVVTLGGERRPQLLRRARGYAPRPLPLPLPAPRPVLACGGQLKNSFCLARGERAWPSHHIGDLGEYETLRAFGEGVAHLERLFGFAPEVIAHDLHPEYLATKYALERVARAREGAGGEDARAAPAKRVTLGVQHHHAHLAACLAEHGQRGPALGVIFDGTGYGPDGTIWGGEFLLGDLRGYRRLGHLHPVRLPGGEAAIREPWRMACAWLVETVRTRPPLPPLPPTLVGRVEPGRWAAVARLAQSGVAAPRTTSVGRLFDAVAALCGLCTHASYEGEAAVALEAAIDPGERGSYPLPIVEGVGAAPTVLDARPLIRAVTAALLRDVPVGTIAARFHNTLARAVAAACELLAARHGIRVVALSGGVFQNRELIERSAAELARAGFQVLTPLRISPNDGGIAYGQAAIAAACSRAVAPAGAVSPRGGGRNAVPPPLDTEGSDPRS